jgi:hypothetical protein
MIINLNVQSEVIDIRTDRPQQSDIFLVDTNVWVWQTYPNARTSPTKIREYGAYLKTARQNGAVLAYSGLVLAELAHVIERTEWEIYNERSRLRGEALVQSKEFRHNLPNERAKVVKLLETSWMQVQSAAVPVNLTINDITTTAALNRFKEQSLDGYDLLILEAMFNVDPGQVKVITDDMDYATVPDIQLFTGNNRVIQAAITQGKLLQR